MRVLVVFHFMEVEETLVDENEDVVVTWVLGVG
jgi:hypothetical protein